MKCPYCGKEMEQGCIPGSRDTGVLWFPKTGKANGTPPPVIGRKRVEKENGVALCVPTYFGAIPQLEVCLCRECGVRMFRF